MKTDISNPSSMSQEQARATFESQVKELQRDENLDFVAAWKKARTLYPKLYSKLTQGKQPVPEDDKTAVANSQTLSRYKDAFRVELPLANGDAVAAHRRVMEKYPNIRAGLSGAGTAISGQTPPPSGFLFYLPMMKLPSSTTVQEFGVAWRANGNRLSPLNTQAIFDALTSFYVDSKSMSKGEARRAVGAKFPSLAASGEALPNDAGSDGEARNLSLAAIAASDAATDKESHAIGQDLHERAAAAQSDSLTKRMHEMSAKFHRKQATK